MIGIVKKLVTLDDTSDLARANSSDTQTKIHSHAKSHIVKATVARQWPFAEAFTLQENDGSIKTQLQNRTKRQRGFFFRSECLVEKFHFLVYVAKK